MIDERAGTVDRMMWIVRGSAGPVDLLDSLVRFSMSLGAELASKGIDVQAQTPLYVTTKMAKIRKSSITVPGQREGEKLLGAPGRTTRSNVRY